MGKNDWAGLEAKRARGRSGARALPLALATALLLAVLAGGATTAHGEPSCIERQGTWNPCPTNEIVTGKKHQERAYWQQIAGAPHPETTPIEGSATPFEADLFTVRLRNAREAFAGGAICKDPVASEEVQGCERVPVIYATDAEHPWHEAYRSTEPGYVGQVAWIGKGRALAVGGTGTYPRREPNPTGNEWDYEKRVAYDREHGAGDARAFYFHDGAWSELQDKPDPPEGFTGKDGDDLPDEMRGLSALDVWIGREQDGDEWGIAGAYGQLWEWEGARFTGKHIDRDSPGIGASDPEWAVVDGPAYPQTQTCTGVGEARTCSWQPSSTSKFSDPTLFNYRVREIRIAPDRTQKRAFAFTAGCCGPASDGGSRLIEYLPQPSKNRVGVAPSEAPPPESRPRWIVREDHPPTSTDDGNDDYGDSVYSFALRPDRFFNPDNEPDFFFGEPQPEHGALTWEVNAANGLVKAEGGPEQEQAGAGLPSTSTPQPRYVASDGDAQQVTAPCGCSFAPVTGDGIPDWKVGEAPPSDSELRGLGVLATTVTDYKPEYGGLRPYCNVEATVPDLFTNNDPASYPGDTRVCKAEQIQAGNTPSLDPDGPLRTRETGIQLGPSWALNGIDMLDSDSVGYAVGDRGAILRFGAPPAESDPPTLGARRPAQLAERSPYEGRRPAPASVAGEVPPLATQPREQLTDPRMVRAGSPDGNEFDPDLPVADVHTIVMSRDGSEGWAIGPSPEARSGLSKTGGVMTLYHYEAGSWTRCDPVGIPGITAPDRACASLADLYRFNGSGLNKTRIRLDAAARIPLEYDADPSNDDEFEVLAVGSTLEKDGTRPIPTVIRYREGRWRLEDFEMRSSLNPQSESSVGSSDLTATSLACTGPDECWLVGKQASRLVLRRFDGERWVDCSKATGIVVDAPLTNRSACGDRGNRLTRLSISNDRIDRLAVASAGERVYLAGTRLGAGTNVFGADVSAKSPVILYKDRGKGEQWQAEGGGYDPLFDDPGAPPGQVASLSVARRPDGSYEGWAVGIFEGADAQSIKWPLMRLDPESGEWSVWRVRDAAYDYLGPTVYSRPQGLEVTPQHQLVLAGTGSEPGRAFIGVPPAGEADYTFQIPQLLAFNPERGRWELAQKPDAARKVLVPGGPPRPTALAPDGRGGVWAAFGTEVEYLLSVGHSETYFYNYTQTPPREVFEEVASPLADPAERLTDLAGSADGSVWVTSDRGALYRRDRATGWERVAIPGWDPGRVATNPSDVNAIALGPDGSGLAVGEGGRIAEVSPDQVRLDDAAGTVCETGAPVAPCGTSFDLRSAAIAPDGAAMVGGEKLALLWRPAGGELRRIAGPDAPPFATITGIALPASDRAWVALDSGQLFSGVGDGQGGWRWRLENAVEVNGVDRLLTEDRRAEPSALRDVAVDAAGHGFAVGDRGVVLERTGDPDQPWRRVESGITEKLTSVALPATNGPEALIGGDRGLVLTLVDGEWRIARPGDQLRPDNGYVAGVALLPGAEDGQVEAWAGVSAQRVWFDNREGTSQILHYTNAPEEPLLDLAGGAEPLPDVPEPRVGAISFAAFGRLDCQLAAKGGICPPLENGTELEQTILRRVREEVLARMGEPGGPQFTVWTGDAYETGGKAAIEPVEQNSRLAAHAAIFASNAIVSPGWTGGERYRRFNEQLTDYLPDRGLPTFGAIGARDLSEADPCPGFSCVRSSSSNTGRAGENLAWRQAMEEQPAPWGGGDPVESAALSFEPLDDSGLAIRYEDQRVDDPTGGEGVEVDGGDDIVVPDPNGSCCLPPEVRVQRKADVPPPDPIQVPTGGASTHYAMDVVSPEAEEPIARLVFVDTSLGSLTASDPIQQPLEGEGGQLAWLERVLCIEGSPSDTGSCTRSPDQQAIVVSNTPTYSYVPTSPEELATDSALFESILLRHHANVVVSGRLGWNGRYWATAPGLHEPCPGQGYVADQDAPAPGTRVCGSQVGGGPTDTGQVGADAQGQALDAAGTLGGTGVLPFVVASNAGGRFNEAASRSGQASAEDGFWRGYSIVHLDPSGDPRRTIVEQRPIFDWVSIEGQEHVLGARERLSLRGVGREPIGAAAGSGGTFGSARFDEISTPAITHRFDLVLADPEQPWTPCLSSDSACVALHSRLNLSSRAEASRSDAAAEGSQSASATAASLGSENPCDPYLCLPANVGTIDDQSGAVQAGNGKYPDTFAVAILSVGDHVGSYPVMFKRSPSFVVEPLRLSAPLPATPSAAPNPPQPPNPPSPPQPNVPQPNVPEIPAPPPVPPIAATQPPEPQPPAPPAPPPPTEQPSPLSLTLAPPGIAIATPTAVIQPPTPPVNPAPPGGARREARQRQAAAQKSGADNEATDGVGDLGGDRVDSPNAPGTAFTRHDHSFTALPRPTHQRAGSPFHRGAGGRPEPSFTPLRQESPTASAQGLLYGGGITLLALAAALGWTYGRPTPRRRPPEVPAPAWSRLNSRRR